MRWIKYGTQSDVRFTMVKRGVVDLAVTGDWTPAAADSAISKDGGNYADTTNTVAVIGGTPTRGVVGWKLTISATEAQAAEINIQIVDAATKAVEDQFLTVFTYGNASAKFAGDWSDIVRLGLTALPNAAAEAAGGLYTRGAGAGQIKQTNNGEVDSNVTHINNVASTAVTTIKAVQGLTTADVVASVTGAVGSVTGAVGSVGAGGIAAATFAAGAVDASAIAADAIGASELAQGAADKIVDTTTSDGTVTIRQAFRLFLATLAGKADGGGTATMHYRDTADTKNVITATVDVNGNRSAVTLNP